MTSELYEDDFAALARIDVLVGNLESATSRFNVAESGSELHEDDESTASPGYAGSVIASAMNAATCGLQGFQALCIGMEKLRRSTTFGYVHRAALLGACEAYWVLSPHDRNERVHRANHAALRLLNDELESKTDIQSMTKLFQDDRVVTDEELVAIKDRRDSFSRAVGGKPISLTRMFKEVAKDLVNEGSFQGADTEHFSQVVRSQWRVSSADAHGRIWQHRFNDPIAPDNDSDSPTPQRVADMGLIISKALTVAEIADQARQLWEQRITREP